jgi:hypothetical protein
MLCASRSVGTRRCQVGEQVGQSRRQLELVAQVERKPNCPIYVILDTKCLRNLSHKTHPRTNGYGWIVEAVFDEIAHQARDLEKAIHLPISSPLRYPQQVVQVPNSGVIRRQHKRPAFLTGPAFAKKGKTTTLRFTTIRG